MDPQITNNVMIDVETFGPRPRGLVVSIGAVCFSTSQADYESNRIFSGRPEDEFHAVLNLDASESESRFVKHPAMLKWWREQPRAYAQLCALMRASDLDTKGLMAAFIDWIKPFCDQEYNIVANSPSFDLVMIENACDVVDLTFPVGYRAEADYRMLTDLVWGPVNKPRPGPNDAHDALFDAKFQANCYVEALLTVGKWKQAAAGR